MPLVKNEVYKKVLATKEIDLIKPKELKKWFDKIPTTKKPRKATNEHCKVLLIMLYYTGARPGEIVDLKPEDIKLIVLPKTEDSPSVRAYQITFKTLKKGKELRNWLLPKNYLTSYCFAQIKRQHPLQFYFYAFQSKRGAAKNLVKWVNRKTIYVREDGKLYKEELIENKERLYFKKGNLINKYITSLTGLPPYFFRHHRATWMFDKGASIKEIADWKGGKVENVVTYIATTSARKKKQLKYF